MPLPGIAQNVGGVGVGDPYFQNVILLMPFDTSTTGQQQYGAAQTFTVTGAPVIDNSPALYGAGSIFFDGTGDNLYNGDAAYWDFGTGDFTIEFAIYTGEKDNNRGILDMRDGSSGNGFLCENTDTGSGTLQFRINNNNYYSTTSISNNVWYQIAISRVSGQLYSYINGTRVDVTASTTNLSSNRLTLGTYIDQRGTGTNYHWKGWMDELRITKGVGRYTGTTYQLQGGPFPNY
jgi:hypothetical protein